MQKYITLFLITLMMITTLSAQQSAWRRANGTEGIRISDIEIYYSNPDTLYASGFGLMLSTDRGENWQIVSLNPQGKHSINTAAENAFSGYGTVLGIDPFNSKQLYLNHAGLPFDGNEVLMSVDGGLNWNSLFRGRCEPSPGCDSPIIEIDPFDLNTIYTSLNTNKILRSSNRGVTWDTVPTPYAFGLSSISISPSNNNIIYLGYGSVLEIYKSTDQGQSWQLLPFPLLYQNNSPVYLAVNPHNPDTLYAAVFSYGYFPGGVYKSTDGGFTWEEKNNGLTSDDWDINAISINFVNPDELFIGTGGGFPQANILFRSINGGEYWDQFTNGLPDSGHVSSIVIDSEYLRIYIGVNAFNASGIYIYDEVTSVNHESVELPKELYLSQNYPNPFNSVAIIPYIIPERAYVELSVYNILGKEIIKLVRGYQSAGTHRAELDASRLSGGIYFYVLRTETTKLVRKTVLIK